PLMGILSVSAVRVVLFSLLADVAYAYIDPRISSAGQPTARRRDADPGRHGRRRRRRWRQAVQFPRAHLPAVHAPSHGEMGSAGSGHSDRGLLRGTTLALGVSELHPGPRPVLVARRRHRSLPSAPDGNGLL